MGMISRVRARLQSIHAIPNKMDARIQEEKTAQSVCLLSVVLLLPYLARGHASILVGGVGLAYSCLVIPMVISANYKYPPVGHVRAITNYIKGLCAGVLKPVLDLLRRAYAPLDRTERVYMKMTNISTMINQLVFFMLCDRVLLPTQRVTCLYSLMFYNVIAYCVSYIKELIEKEDWSPYVTMAEHSNIKHLAMSATKIVLEWTKAVTFIITVVFMLLVFGLEQGLEHYHPTSFYTVVTWLYYMATEKVFVECFPTLLTLLQLDILESLESLWAPVLLRIFTMCMSVVFALPLALYGQYRAVFVAVYLNVYLRWREMSANSLQVLNVERTVLSQYRYATADELASFDDVCAVCLSPMRLARITPCHHIFHGDCLRQCLKASDNCPICKRELKFD
ncbi:E3 ubiquitin-protein ligase AMFR [Anabrus simplex]|uniref:E3 ubiquitin-protein ligase AMFR n=1 Tax=Anabrus simplex TaxID=316456 RepID=UPI0034DCE743